MIQVIASEPRPAAERQRRRLLLDPDLLLTPGPDASGTSADECDTFSLVLHDLRMGGTWKRTNRGRLPQTERALSEQLAGRGSVRLLDLGASDGITTFEAVRALREALGVDVTAVLADVNLYLHRFRMGPLVEYRASGGEPIMARAGKLGLRLSKHRPALRQSPDPLVGLYLRLSPLRRRLRPDARIPLIHPLARVERAITPFEMDCLERQPGLVDSVDAIRASNVLNHGYFTSAQLHSAVTHLHAYLKEGGCLVVSRNVDGPRGEAECGSVWRKRGTRFEHRKDFGLGSELRDIVSAWRAPTAAPIPGPAATTI